jgi:ornithine lipid ester-linked acyl 2-hydroxylase
MEFNMEVIARTASIPFSFKKSTISNHDIIMKIWYSIYNIKAYTGNEPAFYRSDDFDWAKVIEKNWLTIKNELDAHLSSNPRFISYNKEQTVNYRGSWKTMPLITWGVEFHKNICNFPLTTEVLKQIPGLASASFNLLEKKSEIKKHFGETNANVRVHLGLNIPGNLPAVGFKVNGISRSWEEGKVLIFCDGYEHSGWNHSDQDRYILLLDIIRPEFIHRKRLICSNVLATLSLQSVICRSACLFYVIFIPLSILHFFAKISAMMGTPLYNFLSRNKVMKYFVK